MFTTTISTELIWDWRRTHPASGNLDSIFQDCVIPWIRRFASSLRTLLPSRVDSQLCLLRVSGEGLSASRFNGVRLSLHGLDTALGLRLISKFKLCAPTFLLHDRCAFNFGEGQALPLENPEMDGQVLLGVLTNGF